MSIAELIRRERRARKTVVFVSFLCIVLTFMNVLLVRKVVELQEEHEIPRELITGRGCRYSVILSPDLMPDNQ